MRHSLADHIGVDGLHALAHARGVPVREVGRRRRGGAEIDQPARAFIAVAEIRREALPLIRGPRVGVGLNDPMLERPH